MSTPATGSWRDKYLDALEQQEQLQQHIELLNKAVSRVSLAAEGQSTELDGKLSALKSANKCADKDGGRQLTAALSSLDNYLRHQPEPSTNSAAKPANAKKGKPSSAAKTLLTMAEDMLPHCRSKTLKQQLKGYIKTLKSQPAGDMTPMLKTLAYLQGEVLSQPQPEANNSTGLLQRLFGSNNDAEEKQEDNQQDKQKEKQQAPDQVVDEEINEDVAQQPFEGPSGITKDVEATGESVSAESISVKPAVSEPLEGQLQTKREAEAQDQLEAKLQRPVHEPAFSRISDKVKRVLDDLLDQVQPVACTEQKALDARERLERGLNWYELVPTLEDIRDLILQAYLLADEEYKLYLQQLQQVLQGILDTLGITLEQHAQWQAADDAFEQELTQQLGSLARSVSVATEVHDLKQGVDEHLQAIQMALATRKQITTDLSIEQKLQELQQRVQQAEQNAEQTKQELEEQKQKAVTDALTGLPNREAYNQRAHLEWDRWQRYGHPLTIAVIDIDHFKKINDNYGHQTGDRVLQVLSKAVSKRLRKVDFMARYGGEEFVVLLPDTELENAFSLMDKIRGAVAETPFRFKQEPVQVTLSCGLMQLQEDDTLEAAFARADELLYKAKEAGRNCCMR